MAVTSGSSLAALPRLVVVALSVLAPASTLAAQAQAALQKAAALVEEGRLQEADQQVQLALADPGTRAAIQDIIAQQDAAEWQRRFEGTDTCVTVVKTLEEAVRSPHFAARGLFTQTLDDGAGKTIPALPVPISPALVRDAARTAPLLGDTDASAIR